MDGLERTSAATVRTPTPGDASTPVLPASCCSTTTLPADVLRPWVRDRRVLAGVGLVFAGSGLVLGWDWLTAVGVAPLIVSSAPCLLMCALGLCMMRRGHRVGSASTASGATDHVTTTDRDAST